MTYQIAKFYKCIINYCIEFEPDCSKIDGVVAFYLDKRILAFFFNHPVAMAKAGSSAELQLSIYWLGVRGQKYIAKLLIFH